MSAAHSDARGSGTGDVAVGDALWEEIREGRSPTPERRLTAP